MEVGLAPSRMGTVPCLSGRRDMYGDVAAPDQNWGRLRGAAVPLHRDARRIAHLDPCGVR